MLFVIRAGLNFLGGYILRWTGERVVTDLRARVYQHLHTLGLGYFSRKRIGDITSCLTNDVASVRAAVTDAVVSLLIQFFKLAGSIALMLVLNWRLSLLVLVVVSLVTIVSRFSGGVLRRLARSVQDRLADTTAIAEEALSGIHVVKAFARVPYEVDRYNHAVEILFDASRRRALVMAFYGAVVNLLFVLAVVAIFWYGGIEVLAGRLTAGELVAFLFYALNISQSVGQLTQLYATFNTAAGASARIFELLDTQPEIMDARGAIAPPRLRGAVCFEHVGFSYNNGHPVLHDITLQVRPGETVALVGPSGAGKTTLLHLIPRFFDPAHGRVLIDGRDVRSIRLQCLREQIAVVTQEVHLFCASIKENIRYGRLGASDAGIQVAARTANAHGFILDLPDGYDTDIGERGVKLSGGQRQRIAIARALLRDVPILLLDEATSSLDTESEALIQEAMKRLTCERTTFIIAHRLATVQEADRIFVVENGSITECGTHEELVTRRGLYSRLAVRQLSPTRFGSRQTDYPAETPGSKAAAQAV